MFDRIPDLPINPIKGPSIEMIWIDPEYIPSIEREVNLEFHESDIQLSFVPRSTNRISFKNDIMRVEYHGLQEYNAVVPTSTLNFSGLGSSTESLVLYHEVLSTLKSSTKWFVYRYNFPLDESMLAKNLATYKDSQENANIHNRIVALFFQLWRFRETLSKIDKSISDILKFPDNGDEQLISMRSIVLENMTEQREIIKRILLQIPINLNRAYLMRLYESHLKRLGSLDKPITEIPMPESLMTQASVFISMKYKSALIRSPEWFWKNLVTRIGGRLEIDVDKFEIRDSDKKLLVKIDISSSILIINYVILKHPTIFLSLLSQIEGELFIHNLVIFGFTNLPITELSDLSMILENTATIDRDNKVLIYRRLVPYLEKGQLNADK